MDPLDHQVLLVRQALQVQLENKEIVVIKEIEELPGLKVPQGQEEKVDHQDRRVRPELLEHRDPKEKRDLRVRLVLRDHRDQEERLVHKDLKDYKANKVQEGQVAHQDPPDSVEKTEIVEIRDV